MKSILLFTLTLLLAGCTTYQVDSFSKENQDTLNFLQATPFFAVTKNGDLSLKNAKNPAHKQFFLVKNIDTTPLVLDMPNAHIGATAWITQYIPMHEWEAYLYVKDHNLFETNQGKKPIIWQCFNGKTGKKYRSCKGHIKVFTIPYQEKILKASNSIIHQSMLHALKRNQSFWISDAHTHIAAIFLNSYHKEAS